MTRNSGSGETNLSAGRKRLFDPLWEHIGRQLRCPGGAWGRLAGHLMARVNASPNRAAINALDVRPRDTVLELGFGPGLAIRALAEKAHEGLVTGVDRSPTMLMQARRRNRIAIRQGRVRLGLGGFAPLSLPPASVDKVLAVNTAYFFSPDGDEIREMRRVLRPGGRLVIYVTDQESMSEWKFAGPDTHRLYDETALRALLSHGGFRTGETGIRKVRMPFGVTGLLAVARKPARRRRRDRG